MSEDGSLDAAVKRLALALDALDAAVERRRDGDQREHNLAAQLHALGNDRARLAATLDGEAARIRTLEDTHRDVVARIDVAMQTIRTVIESNDR
jgi:hypothetical protein